MSSKRKQFKIYGPHHFTATWKKYREICKRDGRSVSEEIRVFVESQVRGRDPGNPQRPLTAYSPGHRDQVVLQEQETFKKLQGVAEENRGKIRWLRIVDELRGSVPARSLVPTAEKIGHRLHKAGIKVIRRA